MEPITQFMVKWFTLIITEKGVHMLPKTAKELIETMLKLPSMNLTRMGTETGISPRTLRRIVSQGNASWKSEHKLICYYLNQRETLSQQPHLIPLNPMSLEYS